MVSKFDPHVLKKTHIRLKDGYENNILWGLVTKKQDELPKKLSIDVLIN